MIVMADVQETRNALWRRDEQIQRWNLSETNMESVERKNRNSAKIKFQDGCVFLAACSSGDTDEVQKLLNKNADINTANIDGLTALHQACIDDNVDMVEFLIDHNADINACDNEGWTPLHATASCSFLEVARFLIDKGANLSAVNNEGELAYDLADGEDMEDLISKHMDDQGIDVELARNEEEEIMLRDANQWLNSGRIEDTPHPKTGATALHVAAAKGYIKVMSILIQAKADIDAKDYDGWTALHAAAHWGQEEACKALVDNLCNMEARNHAGQTALDVADPDLEPLLEQLKKKQASLKKDKEETENKLNEIATTRNILPATRRSSVTRMSVDQKQNVVHKTAAEERVHLEALHRTSPSREEEERGKISEDSQEEGTSGEEESSSEEASSSDEEVEDKKNTPVQVDTAKLNELNRQVSSSLGPDQVNGDIQDSKRPSPSMTLPTTSTTEAPPTSTSTLPPKTSSVTPSTSSTPRIHDMVDTVKQEASKDKVAQNNKLISEREKEREQELEREKEKEKQREKEQARLDKEKEEERKKATLIKEEQRQKEEKRLKDEQRLKEEKKLKDEQRLKEEKKLKDEQRLKEEKKLKDEQRLKEEKKLKDEQRLKEEKKLKDEKNPADMTKHSSQPEESSGLSISLVSRSTLNRTVSLPNPDMPSSNQVPSLSSRPASVLEKFRESPSSWRAGLRKTPSSSAVPESTSRLAGLASAKRESGSDKLLRSASSSSITPDKSDSDLNKRISGTGMGDSQDTRARFSDFYSRYHTLLGSITSTADSSSTTTTTTSTGNHTNKPSLSTAVTMSTSSASIATPNASSSSYNYTPYMPLSRRRPTSELASDDKAASDGVRGDRHSTLGLMSGAGRRSFEPPKRDEEKEVERKAKAKRARESRRSTQGVTREDLERAEKTLLAADKAPASTTGSSSDSTGDKENQPDDSSSVVMRTRRAHVTPVSKEKKEVDESALNQYRKSRDHASILFENSVPTSSQYTRGSVRKSALSNTPSTGVLGSTATTTIISTTPSSTIISSSTPSTTPFRSSHRASRNLLPPPAPARAHTDTDEHSKNLDGKEVAEKEDPSQKSTAIRTRRKRESRRPTGKVTLDDLQQVTEDQTDSKETEDKKDDSSKSSSVASSHRGSYSSRYTDPSNLYGGGEGSRYSGRGERASSASSTPYSSRTYSSTSLQESKSEDVDYKKLYDEEKQETERLKRDIKKLQQETLENKADLDRYKAMYESNKNMESSSERREKRALERKISELEEELKDVESLKVDNQRLKDENGALIRVISKLSK